MRPPLYVLKQAGLLEFQDMPRDNARLASRTNFLYSFKHQKCIDRLSEDCFKTMKNLIERVREEQEKVQSTVDKANRSDVIGREEELLSESERAALKEWKRVESTLWGQVMRIDDTVALFQEF